MESIPIGEHNMFSTDESNIMRMRWQSHDLVKQLWKNLAYMEVSYEKGKARLTSTIPEEQKHIIKPPMNVEGARMVINIIESVVNPVVSLTKIHQDQASVLLAHIKQLARRQIAVKGRQYGCERRADKQAVLQIIETICFTQLMRAVGGHESKQAKTSYVDKNESGTYTTNTSGGWNPFKKLQGEQG